MNTDKRQPALGALAAFLGRRLLVVPEAPEEGETLSGGACCYEEGRKGRTVRRRWVPWASLLLNRFGVDIFTCSKCEGRMQQIAFITQPRVIDAILECVGERENRPRANGTL